MHDLAANGIYRSLLMECMRMSRIIDPVTGWRFVYVAWGEHWHSVHINLGSILTSRFCRLYFIGTLSCIHYHKRIFFFACIFCLYSYHYHLCMCMRICFAYKLISLYSPLYNVYPRLCLYPSSDRCAHVNYSAVLSRCPLERRPMGSLR